jgi:hypothetical protein
VRARSLAYLLFERPELDTAERFLHDFGLHTVQRDATTLYLRANDAAPWCYAVQCGPRARFLGLGFSVASRTDLQALAALPGASGIEALHAPGGGERVRLVAPGELRIDAVHGRAPAEVLAHRAPLAQNHDATRPRVNATQRPPVAPPEVLRLGHVALETAFYQATCAWLTQHLGLIPSDVQVLPDGSPVVTFFRLDLGDTPADHHTVALVQGFMTGYSHSAFEVVDVDAVGMGQRVLRECGWTHAWGMGRHILGSQIFDYWSDPWGSHHEHYCDGDVFTAEAPTGLHPVSAEAMAQWGQRMPVSFVRPRMNLSAFMMLLRNLRRSPDLSVSKLLALARQMS